jgi:hypothetical protein
MLHVALLAVSLLSLPILASSGWKPHGDEEPIGRILCCSSPPIGLPYFLLSTTTPLLQAWYWRRFRSVVPYRPVRALQPSRRSWRCSAFRCCSSPPST